VNITHYKETHSKAAEFLRLVCAMLGDHKLTANPINFAVCYEYVSGENPPFNAAMDLIIEKEGACTGANAYELFKRYIWDEDKRIVDKLRREFSSLITGTVAGVGQSQAHASDSAEKLEAHSRRFEEENSIDDFQEILTDVVKETKEVAKNGHSLRQMLDETKIEIELLRQDLEHTKREATTDSLTGLTNRRAFEIAMRSFIDASGNFASKLCLLLIDIDHFKNVNDKYGHVFGDKVLKSVASLLMENIKGKDTIARIGGEEFAILLPDTKLEFANVVAENLRYAIEKSRIKKMNTGEMFERLTVSIGVTRYNKGETTDKFVDRADQALYQSKNTGRNKVTSQI